MQVGFASVVTGHATFACVAHVFVDEKFKRPGLAKSPMEEITNH